MSEAAGSGDGGSTCGFVRYRMTPAPLFVHCCHCRWCQRETGASFALNAMIEPDRLPPDIHIFTESRQPWVVLAPEVPAVPQHYRASERRQQASLERRAALMARARDATAGP